MKTPDLIIAIKPVVEAFNKLGVAYYIGGSVASSAYGIARATLDVDLVADLKKHHVKLLIEMLQSEYYIDRDVVLSAIHSRTSFNMIHFETMLKVDVFIVRDRSYDKEAFRRKREDTLDVEQETRKFYFSSPEDIIINKLEWFRSGGEVSERQWHDVLGVLKVQKNSLDMKYLRYWTSELGLFDLLEQAIQDSAA